MSTMKKSRPSISVTTSVSSSVVVEKTAVEAEVEATEIEKKNVTEWRQRCAVRLKQGKWPVESDGLPETSGWNKYAAKFEQLVIHGAVPVLFERSVDDHSRALLTVCVDNSKAAYMEYALTVQPKKSKAWTYGDFDVSSFPFSKEKEQMRVVTQIKSDGQRRYACIPRWIQLDPQIIQTHSLVTVWSNRWGKTTPLLDAIVAVVKDPSKALPGAPKTSSRGQNYWIPTRTALLLEQNERERTALLASITSHNQYHAALKTMSLDQLRAILFHSALLSKSTTTAPPLPSLPMLPQSQIAPTATETASSTPSSKTKPPKDTTTTTTTAVASDTLAASFVIVPETHSPIQKMSPPPQEPTPPKQQDPPPLPPKIEPETAAKEEEEAQTNKKSEDLPVQEVAVIIPPTQVPTQGGELMSPAVSAADNGKTIKPLRSGRLQKPQQTKKKRRVTNS